MKNLINILTAETKTLKEQYVEASKNWAIKIYQENQDKKTWRCEEWCKFLGVEPRYKKQMAAKDGKMIEVSVPFYPDGFFNTSASKTLDNAQKQVRKITNHTEESFLAEAINNAEKHYANSIEKLAYRINEKGLDLNNLKVETAHISNNIETILTDGFKTVRAFTILAWGEVNAPHYRYLVK